MPPTPESTPYPEQARRELAAVAHASQRMQQLRFLHSGFPLMLVWGGVLVIGNLGAHYLLAHQRETLMEAWWLGVVSAAIVLSGVIAWRARLRTVESWRLWGLMIMLLLQGWMVFRILSPWSAGQGAVYVSGLILLGSACTTLLFKARLGFIISVVLLLLTYAGYHLCAEAWQLFDWLACGVGGSMLLMAVFLAVWERRLMRTPPLE